MMNQEIGRLDILRNKAMENLESAYADKISKDPKEQLDILEKANPEKIHFLKKMLKDGFGQSNSRLDDVFTIGEIVVIKNSYFKVEEMHPNKLVLKPQKVVDCEK